MCRGRRLVVVLALVASILGAHVRLDIASATVLVPLPDADLVEMSSFIVVGEVLDMESVALTDGGISTRVDIRVEEAVKGHITGGRIVLLEPGGMTDGRLVVIFGSAEYAVGEQVLVFARRRSDGALITTGLALGKYRITYRITGDERSGRLATRTVPTDDVRDLDLFLAQIRDLIGSGPQESYVSPPSPDDGGASGTTTGRFTFLGPPQQLPARWFEPDRGLPVRLGVVNSDTALGKAESERVIAESLAAWTSVASGSIVLEDGGTVGRARSVAGGVCDDRSQIQFNDPFDEIPELRRCRGVLAVGGFCTSTESMRLGGTTFLRISEGDATINDGVGGCVTDVADLVETVAHEIGHVIGLGHSSESPTEANRLLREALMYAFAHHDGRGAALNADDIAGVSTLYPASEAPDGDEDGVPDDRDRCPTTPPGLATDVQGCACTESGSRGCGDANPCTVDVCNEITGACSNRARDCRDEDPCTVDRCDPFTGGCRNDHKGDSDADGLCDPIDNCPLQPDADPTDLDEDGVGDVCECRDGWPGRCIPGRGQARRRCLAEWLPEVPGARARNGLPSARLQCVDGDPSCDADGVRGQCTLRVALCINNDDPRFPGCRPSLLRQLAVKSPKLKRPRDSADTVNAASLSGALDLLAGAIDLDSQGLNLCSDYLPIVVPTRGSRSGSKRLIVNTSTFTGRRGKAKLKVVCQPTPF